MRKNNGFNAKYTINVDFDGTCVTHKYPFIGKDIGAVPVPFDYYQEDEDNYENEE